MEAARMSKTTMRVGIALGVIAVLMIAFGPLILGNFGTTLVVGSSPLSLAVSVIYFLVIVSSLLFSAALVAASLVMRHAESLHAPNTPERGVPQARLAR